MIYSLHRFGHSFDEYFDYKLYDKTPAGKDAFISDKMRYDYYLEMNSMEGIALLKDKGKTYETFKPYFKRDTVAVYSWEDKQAFAGFVAKHPRFIYKPIAECCGKGVHIVEHKGGSVDDLFAELLETGGFIAEKVIAQSEHMARLHPASINTVRVPTVCCKDGVHIFHPFFRMGRAGSVVDNANAGGVFAGVDPETGIVTTPGKTNCGGDFIRHPDTGIVIPGFELPEWNELKLLVSELANILADVHYIGWDLAHTENGWVLVEANGFGQFVTQKIDQKGEKYELLALMAKLK